MTVIFSLEGGSAGLATAFIFCCSYWTKEKGVQVAVLDKCIFTYVYTTNFPFFFSPFTHPDFLNPITVHAKMRFLIYDPLRECGEIEQLLLTLATLYLYKG